MSTSNFLKVLIYYREMKYIIPVVFLILFSLYFLTLPPENIPFANDALISETTVPQSNINIINTSPISILNLRNKKIDTDKYQIVEKLANGVNYEKYLVSYISEGFKVYAILTIPQEKAPEGGFPAIIFNHGYIPPKNYNNLSNYSSYVDYLAKSGFVVLKIDMRGHGKSEGVASGTYFSSTYTIDVISALKSLQKSELVNASRIGVWGHSMSGNLVLRSMLVSDEIKAGVIWAGAVYSYEDFAKYRISDSSYVARPAVQDIQNPNRDNNPEIDKLRQDGNQVDFSNNYWKAVSLTQNINYLKIHSKSIIR
jgi:dienelactone hydrolase